MGSSNDYYEIEHTADWSLVVRAASLPELFVNAARGMYSLVADLDQAPRTVERAVEVKGVDAEALLVNWLNELVYATEMEGEVFIEFAIHHWEPTRLEATARGGTGVPLKKQIKAVTFHNVRIVPADSGYQVTLVFDV